MSKLCSSCKQIKNLEEFSVNNATKDGLQYNCKSCDNAYQRKRKKEKSSEIKENSKKYLKRKRKDREWRLKQLFQSAKARAKNNGREFTITVEDVFKMYPENGMCPVFNFKLEWGDRGFREHSPSIDRIDSSKGYTKENCQIISWKANRLKTDATVNELKALVQFLGG